MAPVKGFRHIINLPSRNVQNAKHMFLGAVTALFLALFAVLSAPIVILCRWGAVIFAKCLNPELTDILGGLSACLASDLFSGKPPRANIVVNITLKGEVQENDLKILAQRNWMEAIDEKTGKMKYARLKQFPVKWLGFYFFKTCKKFHIDNHLFFHDNLGPQDVGNKEEGISKFTETLLNSPFQPEQSPWEVHVIRNYRNDKAYPDQQLTLLFFKMHHVLGDGYSIMATMVGGLGHSLSEFHLPSPEFPNRSFWQNLKSVIALPLSAAYEAIFVTSLLYRSSPWEVSDKGKGRYQYVLRSDPVPIQKIKDIKNFFGLSFTSVLLSAISSAVQKNIKQKDKSITNSGSSHSGSAYCFTVLPLPRRDWNLENRATAALFELPTTHLGNEVERLHLIDRILQNTKASKIPFIVNLYFLVFGAHFSKVSSFFMRQKFISVGLTNFPSLPTNIQVECGNSSYETCDVNFTFGGLEGTAGMTISVLSYSQRIVFAVSAEQALTTRSELAKFIRDILNEIELLSTISKENKKDDELNKIKWLTQ